MIRGIILQYCYVMYKKNAPFRDIDSVRNIRILSSICLFFVINIIFLCTFLTKKNIRAV